MTFSLTTEIEATPQQVWKVLIAVEQWPSWTATMESVNGLDGPDLAVGHRFKVKQPRFTRAIYVVTKLVPGERFVWESKVPGLRTRADHLITPSQTGTELVLRFEYSGLLGGVMGLLLGRMTTQYLHIEATGLAQVCESN